MCAACERGPGEISRAAFALLHHRRLTATARCVTMSHMKEISIRELHRRTGAWVRAARKYGSIIVRDRNVAVAVISPLSEEPPVNVFEHWKPHRKFAERLDRPVGGPLIEDIVSEDRDR
jgi:antitoxin (DNA-binding transcriptional repressor) of toxin-antitoxin stability system